MSHSKHIFLFFLLLVVTCLEYTYLAAQTTFKCDSAVYQMIKDLSRGYQKYDEKKDLSTFTINAEQTLITHTDENGDKTRFHIKKAWDFPEKGVWMYSATSDSENPAKDFSSYIYLFNFNKMEINVLDSGKPGVPLVVYSVKDIYNE